MSVSLAIRISMSIPILFSPVEHKGYLYTDGCVLDNFPIHIFPNDETTLGVSLKHKNKEDIMGIEDYVFTLINCLTCEFEKLKTMKFKDRILYINIPDHISPLDFNIDEENKNKLLSCGYEQTINYFDNMDNTDTDNIK